MLCDACLKKKSLAVPGKCSKCGGTTTAFAYQLCANCSDDLDACEFCAGPLDASVLVGVAATAASNVYVTTVRSTDNGKKFGGICTGEEIHIILDEDQYSGAEWDVAQPLDASFKLKSIGQFVQNPQNPQYGSRTFVFEVRYSGPADIIFNEVRRYRGWYGGAGGSSVLPNGKTFTASFDVK